MIAVVVDVVVVRLRGRGGDGGVWLWWWWWWRVVVVVVAVVGRGEWMGNGRVRACVVAVVVGWWRWWCVAMVVGVDACVYDMRGEDMEREAARPSPALAACRTSSPPTTHRSPPPPMGGLNKWVAIAVRPLRPTPPGDKRED